MWLDRLAGQSPSPSNSQPPSRAYSPAPRRSASGLGPYLTSQQRPGITPRSSSLSLASADSSGSSLLASTRRTTGSALKQTTTAYAGPDPVDVLADLLGRSSPNSSSTPEFPRDPTTSITTEDLKAVFDFSGLSLRSLALSDEPQPASVDVKTQQSAEERGLPYRVLVQLSFADLVY
jgi:hypothetical protein